MTTAEQFIQDHTRHCSNEIIVSTPDGNSYTKSYEAWLTPDQARRAVEIAIEKACEWLSNMPIEDMTYKYDDFDSSEGWDKMIEDFKNYMKGE